MEKILVIHNPVAGDKDHLKEDLIGLVRNHGYECLYTSVSKKNWMEIDDEIDLIIIAGGDGTIRKVANELLNKRVVDKRLPIGLVALGTANNIAKTLEIESKINSIIKQWKKGDLKKIDVGAVTDLNDTDFFVESLGFGVFPELIKEMGKVNKAEIPSKEDELKLALQVLLNIILKAKVKEYRIEMNGKSYKGKYLLVEIMNIRSLGPNLLLAPKADPSDGELDVVLVAENKRDELATHVLEKIQGKEGKLNLDSIRTKQIEIEWEGSTLHVDDQLIKLKEPKILKIEIREGVLDLLT